MFIGGKEDELIKDEKVAKLTLQNPSMYVVDLQKFSFNGQDVAVNLKALLDTGNTLISFPMKFKDKIFAIFKEKNLECETYKESNEDFYQVGCRADSLTDLPDFEVELDAVTFKITGDKLVDRCTRRFFFFGSYNCLLNLEFQKDGYDSIILGKSFLTHTYTTFFLDRKEIWMTQPSMDKYKNWAKNHEHNAADLSHKYALEQDNLDGRILGEEETMLLDDKFRDF